MPAFRPHPLAVLALLTACNTTDHPLSPTVPPLDARSSTVACKDAPPDEIIKLPIAPRSKRIDLGQPVFSHPLEVTNPLFPIKTLRHAVLVGKSSGEDFRAETTLMPTSKVINFAGGPVEVLESQYVAFLDGRLDEVALDWYAQADDGSVWYFGEDVFNYEDGKVVDTHGTWISCKDGPPAMIMPGRPKVGDVFRVENIYPLVFEEVEITGVGQTVPGPLGNVSGALTVRQLHLDTTYAPKTFAPGYGEFSTGSGDDVEALAVAVPADDDRRSTPRSLATLLDAADEAFEAVTKEQWKAADGQVARLVAGWRGYQTDGPPPRLLSPLVVAAIDRLGQAVRARDAEVAGQAAVDVASLGLDLQVRQEKGLEVDLNRLEVFMRQLALDAAAEDDGGARGSLIVLGLILDRVRADGDRDLANRLQRLRRALTEITAANERGDFRAVAQGAERLDQILAR